MCVANRQPQRTAVGERFDRSTEEQLLKLGVDHRRQCCLHHRRPCHERSVQWLPHSICRHVHTIPQINPSNQPRPMSAVRDEKFSQGITHLIKKNGNE
jgi:hypothetical protein